MKEGELSKCCNAITRLLLNEDQEWQNGEEPILICSECGVESEEINELPLWTHNQTID